MAIRLYIEAVGSDTDNPLEVFINNETGKLIVDSDLTHLEDYTLI